MEKTWRRGVEKVNFYRDIIYVDDPLSPNILRKTPAEIFLFINYVEEKAIKSFKRKHESYQKYAVWTFLIFDTTYFW
jgi:hypothetical protein